MDIELFDYRLRVFREVTLNTEDGCREVSPYDVVTGYEDIGFLNVVGLNGVRLPEIQRVDIRKMEKVRRSDMSLGLGYGRVRSYFLLIYGWIKDNVGDSAAEKFKKEFLEDGK